MFSIRKTGRVSTVETSTEVDTTSSSDESVSLKHKTYSIEAAGVIWHTVSFPSVPRFVGCPNPIEVGNVIWQSVALQSLLRSTKNCVMRQCRARRRAPSEGPAPAPPPRCAGYRGILRQNVSKRNSLSALQAKLEAAGSEASAVGSPPRTRCLIGRVPRRGVGVALTVRRHFKHSASSSKLRHLMRKRSY